jgi:hypothetical protein
MLNGGRGLDVIPIFKDLKNTNNLFEARKEESM